MIELNDKIKSEVKSLVDESESHLDFWIKFCEYLYEKGFEDGKLEKEQKIIKEVDGIGSD